MKTKKRSSIKKVMVGFLSLVLIIGVTVAITIALLGALSDKKVNTFVGSKGIDLVLWEPEWDGGTKNDPDPASPSGGVDIAKNYTPGLEIPKDPTVGIKTDSDVWVALKVKFLVDVGTLGVSDYKAVSYDFAANSKMKTFNQIAKLATTTVEATKDFDDTKWILGGTTDDGGYIFYGKVPLKKTTDVKFFDTITIADDLTTDGALVFKSWDAVGKTYTGADITTEAIVSTETVKLPQFKIDIQASAIQIEVGLGEGTITDLSDTTPAKQTEIAAIKAELKGLFQ